MGDGFDWKKGATKQENDQRSDEDGHYRRLRATA